MSCCRIAFVGGKQLNSTGVGESPNNKIQSCPSSESTSTSSATLSTMAPATEGAQTNRSTENTGGVVPDDIPDDEPEPEPVGMVSSL